MIYRKFRDANTAGILFVASVMIHLVVFASACLRFDEASHTGDKNSTNGQAWSVELRDAEHRTIQHPEKKYFATIQPDGLQVSFHTVQDHFGSYTFPHKSFSLGEPVYLLCPGSPDLLPMRVALIKGARNDPNAHHDYKIEWLHESPATSSGAGKVVRSY